MLLEDKVNELTSRNEPVRIHVGCGSRIFENYINVDGEYMKNHPDVTFHNITEAWPLPDNCVDEILSVHVIEHIEPQHVPAMFEEWLRILKPGGFVALEWPDLLKACKKIVANPASLYSKDKKLLKRTVAGIFGNIARYTDPVMLHKWGYSAESMQHLLSETGYTKTSSEANQYGKTEIDSRVVAYK